MDGQHYPHKQQLSQRWHARGRQRATTGANEPNRLYETELLSNGLETYSRCRIKSWNKWRQIGSHPDDGRLLRLLDMRWSLANANITIEREMGLWRPKAVPYRLELCRLRRPPLPQILRRQRHQRPRNRQNPRRLPERVLL